MARRGSEQLELPVVTKAPRSRSGRRKGAGRKRASSDGRPNVPHRTRPEHKGRFPVHVTMRARRDVPPLRTQLVRNLVRDVLKAQAKRSYASEFQVVHFSIQRDHLHLIVEALLPGGAADEARRDGALGEQANRRATQGRGNQEREALRRGISGLAISFARKLNRRLGRRGKVWADRHHRRDLESPTAVRNTIRYVLQNWLRHGMKTFGDGVVDPYSTALRFRGWADPHATILETEPWPDPAPRTWLLREGWTRAGGPLRTTDVPPAARGVRYASIVESYVPSSTRSPR